ncbi:MAG: hypothetical protein HGB32_14980 [Geobacteraceae bacterium]|nr:hypothetical protein [Geobacteraceae bacterium]NTW81428.1 hypothetical protein [Geobacteraceae bacterium]
MCGKKRSSFESSLPRWQRTQFLGLWDIILYSLEDVILALSNIVSTGKIITFAQRDFISANPFGAE